MVPLVHPMERGRHPLGNMTTVHAVELSSQATSSTYEEFVNALWVSLMNPVEMKIQYKNIVERGPSFAFKI